MAEPIWKLLDTEFRSRRAPGWLAPALAGVLLGFLLALVALVVLAPQPRAAVPPTAASTVPAHATLTLDDAFLSQLSAAALHQTTLPFTFSNTRVAIHPANQIALVADASAGPFTRQLAVTGTLAAVDGHLRFSVTQATIGGLSLPPAFDAALQSALNANLATLNDQFQFGGTSYAITSVVTREGLLTLGLAPS